MTTPCNHCVEYGTPGCLGDDCLKHYNWLERQYKAALQNLFGRPDGQMWHDGMERMVDVYVREMGI